MSFLSSLITRITGIPAQHINVASAISLLESIAAPEVDSVVAHLNLTEAQALAASASLLLHAATKRVAVLSGTPTP